MRLVSKGVSWGGELDCHWLAVFLKGFDGVSPELVGNRLLGG